MPDRVFVSFDYDHDRFLKEALIGQSKNPDSPFEVADWSIKEPSPDWRKRARYRIASSDLVIVICGEHTHQALGVGIEVELAQEVGVPYVLIQGYDQRQCTKSTTARATDSVYDWTWPNLKLLVGGAR
ncbi:TIR domain-containing protein [Amycolatopsis mongoliensis]|uniref:TIR domain-containing protein n=1 Tax=Amycolatopsis mongoliensis TaxID=715475 RepID=A0A9Y2JWJ7_9PSEU|nr:TIR domain-containing protein [Amycolatopsis sp. 4-36]WIY05990.1 TIR domain-containing protein [Amycolatopsis sp. 4-36]